MYSEDDNKWPAADRVGKQELDVVIGNTHIKFQVSRGPQAVESCSCPYSI